MIRTCGVLIGKAGPIYANDCNGCLSIMEWGG